MCGYVTLPLLKFDSRYVLLNTHSDPCIGLVHSDVQCDGCFTSSISGLRWKCMHCCEYNLCTLCYMDDKHCLEHPFLCFLNLTTPRFGHQLDN